jgi:hypothetical protein
MAQNKDDSYDFLCSIYIMIDVIKEVLYLLQIAVGRFFMTPF